MTHTLHAISRMAEQLDIGPVADARPLGSGLQIELDEWAVASTLMAWDGLLQKGGAATVDQRGPYVRVHLRGTHAELGELVVTLPLHRNRRARQAEMARNHTGGLFALLRKLTNAE